MQPFSILALKRVWEPQQLTGADGVSPVNEREARSATVSFANPSPPIGRSGAELSECMGSGPAILFGQEQHFLLYVWRPIPADRLLDRRTTFGGL